MWFIRTHIQVPYHRRIYSSVTSDTDACTPLQHQSPIDVLNKAFRGLGASGALTDILTSYSALLVTSSPHGKVGARIQPLLHTRPANTAHLLDLVTSYNQAITRCRLLSHCREMKWLGDGNIRS